MKTNEEAWDALTEAEEVFKKAEKAFKEAVQAYYDTYFHNVSVKPLDTKE